MPPTDVPSSKVAGGSASAPTRDPRKRRPRRRRGGREALSGDAAPVAEVDLEDEELSRAVEGLLAESAEDVADAAAAAQELETLVAIYGDDEDGDVDRPVRLQVVSAREWRFRLGEGLILQVFVPPAYPSREPPTPVLYAPALGDGVEEPLLARLLREYSGAEVVFQWVEMLREELAAVQAAAEAELAALASLAVDGCGAGSSVADVGSGEIGSIPECIKALVKNVHNDRCKVYVGRPMAAPRGARPGGHPKYGWGNPFSMGGGASRGSVIRQYTDWILAPDRAEMRLVARRDLRGKTLGCFCAPLSCHAHVLAMIANSEDDAELEVFAGWGR